MTIRGTVYLFPQIHFVGGETVELRIACKRKLKQGVRPIRIDGATVTFSVLCYTFKNGVPLIVRDAEIHTGPEGVQNMVHVQLEPRDSNEMWGKYIYQLTIEDKYGNMEIPDQGIFYIDKSIFPIPESSNQ